MARAEDHECQEILSRINSTVGAKTAIVEFFRDDPDKSNINRWKRRTKGRNRAQAVVRTFEHVDGTLVSVVYHPTSDGEDGQVPRIHAPRTPHDELGLLPFDKELVGKGAVVVVKANAKRSFNIEYPDRAMPEDGLSVYVDTIPLDGGFSVPVGSRLTVVRGPHKLDGRIHVVLVQFESRQGYVYYGDFKKFVEIETPVPIVRDQNPRKPQVPREYLDTYTVQPIQIGDLVWLSVHTRFMYLSNLGKVIGASNPRGIMMLEIQTLDGKLHTRSERSTDDVFVLPPELFDEAAGFYPNERIKADWFGPRD